jgi:hypothetical protein
MSVLLGSHAIGPPFPTIYPEKGHAALLTQIYKILKCQTVLHCSFTHVHCFALICTRNFDMFCHSVLLFVLLYFVQVTTCLLQTEEFFMVHPTECFVAQKLIKYVNDFSKEYSTWILYNSRGSFVRTLPHGVSSVCRVQGLSYVYVIRMATFLLYNYSVRSLLLLHCFSDRVFMSCFFFILQ